MMASLAPRRFGHRLPKHDLLRSSRAVSASPEQSEASHGNPTSLTVVVVVTSALALICRAAVDSGVATHPPTRDGVATPPVHDPDVPVSGGEAGRSLPGHPSAAGLYALASGLLTPTWVPVDWRLSQVTIR